MIKVLKTAVDLLQETASDWMSDNAPRLGASLAYYTVFSVSPLMIIVLSIAGLWFGQDVAREQIFAEVTLLVGPEGAKAIRGILEQFQRPSTGLWATIIAAVTLLIGSTGVFVELQDALNTIWGVKSKSSSGWFSFVWNRVLSFAMVLGIGFLLLVSLVLSASLAALGKYLGQIAPSVAVLWEWVNFVLSFGVITLLFALIFKVLPDVKIPWRNVWIGALITAFLFTVGKFLLGLYLGRTTVASAYGAAGSVVVILIWVYYSAQIVFFGAEFTQVYASRFDQSLAPVEYAEPIPVENGIPASLKRRGQMAVDPQEVQCARAEPTRARQRSDWKFAVSLAAICAWVMFRRRR
jgi:membrane protein